MAQVVVLIGVSGSGKTTIGQALAQVLGWPFYDGDDFHPPENIAKMAAGHPLDDRDRQPWLERLGRLIHEHLAQDKSALLACSALKKDYRDQLRQGNPGLRFIYLEGDFDLIWERMAARPGHYMQASMLRSQFADLEPPGPEEALAVSIDQPVAAILGEILQALKKRTDNQDEGQQ
jgi:gluconokinase